MIKLISTVGFIILNEENKILLIKQCKEKKAEEVENNGKIAVLKIKEEKENEAEEEWTIPFGNLEEDDDLRDIIKKKVKDCLDCELGECIYFNLYFYNISDNFIKKASYFYGTISGKIKTKENLVLFQWMDLNKDEIDKLNLISEQKEALNDFLNFYQVKDLNKST